jgi:8-oxo-dGTP pyrophosphatase MutT (NUDIX family)
VLGNAAVGGGGDTPCVPSWYRDPNAPSPNQPRRAGGCFLVEVDGGVLIDRRRDDGAFALTGGALDEGESVLDCLARELREETGLEVDSARLLGVFSDPTRLVAYPDGAVNRLLSLAFVVTPRPGREPQPSDESIELRVMSRSELRDLPIWPAHRPIRDAYLVFDGTPVVA